MKIPALGFLALIGLATVPDGAAAQCRSGASALAGQRALAAVRTAIEDECPCAEATSRASWATCADAVIDAAADLPSACAREARSIVGTSSCGSNRVTCARLTEASAGTRVDCRLASAASCGATRARSRRRVATRGGSGGRRAVSLPSSSGGTSERSCTNVASCADVVEWTAGTCVDTRLDGPFGRGATVLDLVKDSAAAPGEDRPLDTTVWYPAPAGTADPNSEWNAAIDAPMEATGGPYPVLVFSHGSCGFPGQSLFLTPYLASHGFIVIAPPHPGNTLFDFPSCGDSENTAEAAVERPNDVIFALDELLRLSEDPDSMFFGMVDPDRIGMGGHSFGGFTTHRATAVDSRFKVAVSLAAAVPPGSDFVIPSLIMLGEIDSVVSNANIRRSYDDARAPKFEVNVLDTGHYAFSDACFPGPDCDPPRTLEQEEAHEHVKRWVLPFLKVHLEGDRSFAPFLEATPPPGVEVRSR